MAYNNNYMNQQPAMIYPGFPAGYQPAQMVYPQQPVQQSQQQQPQTSPNNQIFVDGIEGAKAYPLQYGTTAVLWDASQPLFYIKQVDMQGRPSIAKVCQYEDYVETQQSGQAEPAPDLSQYATKEYIDKLIEHLSVGAQGRIVRNDIDS